MSPLDVVVLLKIISMGNQPWNQKPLAEALFMSQSEISKSFARSRYAGLLDISGKKVRKLAFMEFLQYGIAYVFPQQPGAVVRGIPTAHSAAPLNEFIQSRSSGHREKALFADIALSRSIHRWLMPCKMTQNCTNCSHSLMHLG